MDFQPIQSIQPLFTPENGTNEASGTQADRGMFADIFQSAIDNVKETEAIKNDAQYRLATGQLDNPAELTIAATQAATSVELLVQLRNRTLESYNELMRMGL